MATSFVNEIEYSIYKLDQDMRIVEIDEQFTKMTGYTEEDIRKYEIRQVDLIFEEDQAEYTAMVQKNIAESGEAYIEHRVKCKDGSERFVFCLGQDLVLPDGTQETVVRTMDVTNLIFMRLQAEKIRKENDNELGEWMKLANTDELTGVLRRGGFIPLVEECAKEGGECALLIADADDFKNVNDICGHSVGDSVLKALADVFKRVVRDKDLVCRIGGDEFAIFLRKTPDIYSVQAVAERIIAEVNKLQYLTQEQVPVHVTIGGKLHCGDEAFDVKQMFREADDALYEAKKNGKNQCLIR